MIELAPNNPYGLALQNPVMTAAGCFGFGVEYARLVDLAAIGAIVTRAVALRARAPRPAPQLAETAGGLLYSGPWAARSVDGVLRRHSAAWAAIAAPVIVHVVADHAAVAAELAVADGVAGIEIALPAAPADAARLIAAVRATCELPLLVKLPFAADHRALARAAAEAGADALVAFAPPRAAIADAGAMRDGWLCGAPIRPLLLPLLAELCGDAPLPVVASGGIASVADVAAALAVGAAAAQIGSALLREPWLAAAWPPGA